MDTFIQTGFDAIMQMFGGYVISETLLEYDYEHFGLSFGTLFEHYRKKLMDPVPELKLPMVRHQQGKKQTPLEENSNNNNKIDTLAWSGHLVSKTKPQGKNSSDDHYYGFISTKLFLFYFRWFSNIRRSIGKVSVSSKRKKKKKGFTWYEIHLLIMIIVIGITHRNPTSQQNHQLRHYLMEWNLWKSSHSSLWLKSNWNGWQLLVKTCILSGLPILASRT